MASQSKVGNVSFPFYSNENPCGDRLDFVVERKPVAKNFSVNIIGDVQVGDLQELDYAARTIMA